MKAGTDSQHHVKALTRMHFVKKKKKKRFMQSPCKSSQISNNRDFETCQRGTSGLLASKLQVVSRVSRKR